MGDYENYMQKCKTEKPCKKEKKCEKVIKDNCPITLHTYVFESTPPTNPDFSKKLKDYVNKSLQLNVDLIIFYKTCDEKKIAKKFKKCNTNKKYFKCITIEKYTDENKISKFSVKNWFLTNPGLPTDLNKLELLPIYSALYMAQYIYKTFEFDSESDVWALISKSTTFAFTLEDIKFITLFNVTQPN